VAVNDRPGFPILVGDTVVTRDLTLAIIDMTDKLYMLDDSAVSMFRARPGKAPFYVILGGATTVTSVVSPVNDLDVKPDVRAIRSAGLWIDTFRIVFRPLRFAEGRPLALSQPPALQAAQMPGPHVHPVGDVPVVADQSPEPQRVDGAAAAGQFLAKRLEQVAV
jgi:hypothetical protein